MGGAFTGTHVLEGLQKPSPKNRRTNRTVVSVVDLLTACERSGGHLILANSQEDEFASLAQLEGAHIAHGGKEKGSKEYKNQLSLTKDGKVYTFDFYTTRRPFQP